MTARIIDGRAVARDITAEIADEVGTFRRVGLATVLVGDDPASQIYIARKHEAATAVGIDARDLRLPASTSQLRLLEIIDDLNADDEIDGILVQLPLPAQIDEEAIVRAIDPAKDVDGFHVLNAGELYLGRDGIGPATPSGVIELLRRHRVPVARRHAVVIGRSAIVGRPMAMMLLREDATVTICHRATADLAGLVRQADIVVAAVGRPELVTADMIKPGAAVIDVGINRTEGGLVGDVARGVGDVAGLLTPVPGGVGPMTIAMLLRNTVQAAKARRPVPVAAA
jgi:methylenetetrahydrofolate dehydrogenase (NADP+) / methenyltetrahydrofolate cyclohydrolase